MTDVKPMTSRKNKLGNVLFFFVSFLILLKNEKCKKIQASYKRALFCC